MNILTTGGSSLDRTRVGRQAWLVLIATSFGNFLTGLDTSIANVAFPDIQAEFPSADRAALSWVLTFYAVTFAGLLIVAGRLADRVGRRRVFNLGLGLFVLASLGVALAPSVPIIVAMRGAQGLGAALMTPASLGLVIAAWPVERRTTAVAAWGSVLAISSSVGPTLGGLIIELSSWRWAFLINVPIGLFALWWGHRVLTETERSRDAVRPDVAGAVLVTVAGGGLALAIVQGGEWGWTSASILGLLGLAAVSIGIVAWRTFNHPNPIVPKALFFIPTFRIASIAVFIFSLGFFSAFLTLVLFLTEIWGYSPLSAGLAITALPVAAAISANVSGRVAERIGFRATIIPGCLLFASGALWLWARLGVEPSFVAGLLPATLVMGVGIGMAPAILSAAGVASVGPTNFSVASAVGQMARQLGSAIGVAIVVAILGDSLSTEPAEALASFERAFLYLAAVTTLAGLIASRLRPAAG